MRAACVRILENATKEGNTFLPIQLLKEAAEDLPTINKIPLEADTVDICRDDFLPLVKVIGENKSITVQLDRYVAIGALLMRAVKDRLARPPEPVEANWRQLLDAKFGSMKEADADEERARNEKAIALEDLANSRICVLIGPAGTGKTTVLQLLLRRSDIVGARVRLLAPTGKARVRLGQEIGDGAMYKRSRSSCWMTASMRTPVDTSPIVRRRSRRRPPASLISRRC